MIKKVEELIDKIIDCFTSIAGILLVGIVLVMAASIFSRFFLNIPVGWVIEIGKYVMFLIALLVSAWVLREEGHVGIEVLLIQFKPKIQALIQAFTSALSVIPCIIFVWYGLKVTYKFYLSGYFTPTFLELPQWIFIAVIPITFLFLGIQFVRRSIYFIKEKNDKSDIIQNTNF